MWKWSTSVAGTVVSGKEPSKAAAVVAVEKAIEALVSKRVRLVLLGVDGISDFKA